MKAAGKLAVALAAALAAVAALPATAATAAKPHHPTYRCEFLITTHLPLAEGRHCKARAGAPQHGAIRGAFRIENWRGQSVRCAAQRPLSGYANVPDRVVGRDCAKA